VHPVMTEAFAAERTKEMRAEAAAWRLARKARRQRRGHAVSRAVSPARTQGHPGAPYARSA